MKHKPVRITGPRAKFFKSEERKFGREVAIYNLGFVAGWDDCAKKARAATKRKR